MTTPQNQDAKRQTLAEFGKRLTTLRDGRQGLRTGLTCEVREPQGDEPILDFIASDETVDRYNEVIELGGWQLDNYRRNPVVLDSHDYYSIASVLGRSDEVAIDDGKLRNRVRFALDNPMGTMAYKLARGGFIRSESVGFIPIEWVRGNEAAGEPYRTYKKQELIEISLCAVPANPGATMSAALKSGAVRRDDIKELAEFLKRFCSDEAEPNRDPGARAVGFDGAQLRQVTEQYYESIRAVLRRA
jgi:HK97 family phage prohead protease